MQCISVWVRSRAISTGLNWLTGDEVKQQGAQQPRGIACVGEVWV